MVEQERVDKDGVEASRTHPDDEAATDVGAHSSTATSTRTSERRITIPQSPGWAWLAGVVAVSLALWAGIIWLVVRILR